MMKIMIVDDHKVVRDALSQLLSSQCDMEVVAVATDGQDALRLLNNGLQLNFILTDMNMPGMDGVALTREVLTLKKDLRIVVLTSQPLIAMKKQALAAGAKDCLLKDGNLNEMLASIRAVHAA